MTPEDVLRQYLEGAITFAEFIQWMAGFHIERETKRNEISNVLLD